MTDNLELHVGRRCRIVKLYTMSILAMDSHHQLDILHIINRKMHTKAFNLYHRYIVQNTIGSMRLLINLFAVVVYNVEFECVRDKSFLRDRAFDRFRKSAM